MCQSKEEKREDDARMAWIDYLSENSDTYHVFPYALASKKAFIAGYMAGRKDGEIGE